MNSDKRKALIKGLAIARGMAWGVFVAGTISTSNAEIRETVETVTRDKVETVNEDEMQWESALPFDRVTVANEGECTLSQREREEIRRDVLRKRAKAGKVERFATVERPSSEADLADYSELSNFAHS